MKAKFILVSFVALLFSFHAHSQSAEPVTYYVTIGVFAVHNNAIRYTDLANRDNFSAQYAINPAKKFYYVYLLSTTDRKKAFAFAIKMRVETKFKDAWVFIGKLGEEQPVAVKEPPKVVEKVVEKVAPAAVPALVIQEVKKDSVKTAPVVKVDSSTLKKAEAKKPAVKHDGKPFLFQLTTDGGKIVMGEVHVQESERATQYQAFKANEVVYLRPPTNAEGTYTVVTQAPGYQQIATTLTYKDPGGAKGDQDESIIPLAVKLAKAGNYIDFNNVKFVRNSSIMNPGSQDELDGLVALMKENTKYRIKIHGHCNGKQNREIIVLGKSKNFFAMDPKANVKKTTSAKALSEARADAVKSYLVSQGIDESRITTKGEGGRIPLYPEGSTAANLNDRVEIEIK